MQDDLIAVEEGGEVVTQRVGLLAARAVMYLLRRVVRARAAVAALVAVIPAAAAAAQTHAPSEERERSSKFITAVAKKVRVHV